MATITELQTGDSGSTSLGVINTNFENINEDKIEADSTDTLTNKTIDADATGNNISNLDTANTKTSAKSGLDTTFVTGTKGSANELAMWNSDGDAVSSGKTVTPTAPTSSSTDNTIPTSQAVYEALSGQSNKEFFILPAKGADAVLSVTGTLPFMQLDAGETGYFSFFVPQNLNAFTSVDLIIYPDATESLQMDVVVNAGAIGEAYNTHTTTVSNTTKSVTVDDFTAWELTALAGSPFANILANDFVSISITSDTTLTRVVGLRVRYT